MFNNSMIFRASMAAQFVKSFLPTEMVGEMNQVFWGIIEGIECEDMARVEDELRQQWLQEVPHGRDLDWDKVWAEGIDMCYAYWAWFSDTIGADPRLRSAEVRAEQLALVRQTLTVMLDPFGTDELSALIARGRTVRMETLFPGTSQD